MSKKLFDRKTNYLVLALVIVAALMLGLCERVEAAESGWSAEYYHDSNADSGSSKFNQGFDRIGGRYTYESGASIYLAPLVAVGGSIRGGFDFGFAERWKRFEGQLQLSYYDENMYGGFSVRRIIGDGPFQLSLGGSYWIDESPGSDTPFTFNLGMRYNF